MKPHQTLRTFPGMSVPWSPPKGGITMMWPNASLPAMRDGVSISAIAGDIINPACLNFASSIWME
jgi:hypothetical protein